MTRTLFVTVLGYMICWTPVLIDDVFERDVGNFSLSRGIYVMCTTFGITSSSLNPNIYGALNQIFRREYKKVLCFKKELDQDNNSQCEVTNTNNPYV